MMFCNLQAQSPTNYLQGLDGRPIIAAPVFTKVICSTTYLKTRDKLIVLRGNQKFLTKIKKTELCIS